MARLPLLGLLLVVCSCSGGAEGDSPGGSSGGSASASGGRSGSQEAEPQNDCERVCSRHAEQCEVDSSCSIVCSLWPTYFTGCEAEYDAYFACAAEHLEDFSCEVDFVLEAPQECEWEQAALSYCDRAEGQICRHEPAFDESCAAGTPKPPHYTFCRIDAEPSDECVPSSTGSDPYPPFSWCCPPE